MRELDRRLSIAAEVIAAAFAFSDLARSKIQNGNGNCISILELMKKNPTGKNVILMG